MTAAPTAAGTATAAGHVFRLPDLGEGLTEAEILEWRVAAGDVVAVDQIVVEVETAKAAVDVPVPVAGTVVRLHAGAGTVVEVGQPLLTVAPADAPAAPEATGDGDEAGRDRHREEERAGSGNVLVGYGTSDGRGSRRRAARRAARAASLARTPAHPGTVPAADAAGAATETAPAARPANDAGDAAAGAQDPPGAAARGRAEAPRVISPVVRRLAREHGLDVAALAPSGPGGVLLRRDVDAAITAMAVPDDASGTAATGGARVRNVPPGIAGRTGGPELRDDARSPGRAGAGTAVPGPADAAPAASSGADVPGSGAAAAGRADEPVRIPLRGLRRTVADKLARSRREIPDATTWVDVDATPLMEFKDELRRACPEAGVGTLALLARICIAGLHRYPRLNAYVDTERAEIVQLPRVNLGFAAQTDRGLMVPVVHDAHRLTLTELAERLRELTARAREGTLAPRDLTGGTFTLNNYGVFGVDGSTPIINHPEAGLLGVGRIVDRPWGVDGELRLRKVTQLSFTFDHRVCDGGVAGGFLRFVADCVERPQVLITNL